MTPRSKQSNPENKLFYKTTDPISTKKKKKMWGEGLLLQVIGNLRSITIKCDV